MPILRDGDHAYAIVETKWILPRTGRQSITVVDVTGIAPHDAEMLLGHVALDGQSVQVACWGIGDRFGICHVDVAEEIRGRVVPVAEVEIDLRIVREE
jgi:hypothetical protein